MFQIELTVLVQGRNGLMGLSRRLRLPFIPFPGLELLGITSKPDRPEEVVFVAWDVRKRRFVAELMDRDEPDRGVAELINSYGPTWRLREPGMDNEQEAC